VELDLDVADILDPATVDKVVKQGEFAALDVDLEEIDFRQAGFRKEIGESAESHLLHWPPDGGGVEGAGGVGIIVHLQFLLLVSESKRQADYGSVVREPGLAFAVEPRNWLKKPDSAAESRTDLRREISLVTAYVKDDGFGAKVIVQAKLPVALSGEP
jgi:hypothetical protein